MKAAIYARYSSHNQRDVSIEIQVGKCREYCAEKGWLVVGEYCDHAVSGRSSDRAQFQRMMDDAAAGCFDVVVVWKVTRIMRNRDEMAVTRMMLKRRGVSMAYAGEDVPDGSGGTLMLGLLEVLAEYESELTAERIRDGIAKNAKDGKASGVRLFGYDVDGSDRFVVNGHEAEAVRLAFQRVLDGWTVQQVVDSLGAWRSRNGRPLSWQSVQNILRNRKYMGEYSYAGEVKEDWMPAIIDRETFERVQEVLDSKHPAPRRTGEYRYALTGKLFDQDGRPMSGTSGTSKTGKVHRYYRVKGQGQRVRCDVVERAVADAVASALADTPTRERIADLFMEYQKEGAGPKGHSELDDVRLRIGRIEAAIEAGAPFDVDRLKELHARAAELERSEAIRAPRGYTRQQVSTLLESAAQMDAERAIDVFVSCVVWGEDGCAVEFSFDGAPNPRGGDLAQIQNWWGKLGVKPTRSGFVVFTRAA